MRDGDLMYSRASVRELSIVNAGKEIGNANGLFPSASLDFLGFYNSH